MKKAIITGATGMVGGYVLQHCLNSEEINEVVSVTRKPCGISHSKLTEITPKSFLDYSDLEAHFKNVAVAFFCIGVYTGAVPDEKFKEITVDYTVAFANMLKQQSPKSYFCFLSGAGADPKEKSRTSFARYKGMAENYLIAQNFGSLQLFRPGYIYPVEKRKEPNFGYRLYRKLYPAIKLLGPKLSITSTQLAEAMFKMGLNPRNKTILENEDILGLLN